jgi:hypothetical protein
MFEEATRFAYNRAALHAYRPHMTLDPAESVWRESAKQLVVTRCVIGLLLLHVRSFCANGIITALHRTKSRQNSTKLWRT